MREAEVTDPGHMGERKCCQQEGYYVAMRVPFVLIKKDRTSTLQLSHTAKCWLEHPSHREALSLSAAFSLIT